MIADALSYAARGWPVLPLWWPTSTGCACGKTGCEKNIGKHPLWRAVPNGLDGATTTARIIRSWWQRWPRANVGIRTGAVSGLIVVDVDPRNGGDHGLAELEERYGALPTTPATITGSGGAHYFLGHPGAGVVVHCRKNLGGLEGVDLKADRGFIVAPPSMHKSGRTYTWDLLAHIDDLPLAPCPPKILELAAGGSVERASVEISEWDGTEPGWLTAMLKIDRHLRRRFMGESAGLNDQSDSGVEASLLSLAASRFALPADRLCVLLAASRRRRGLPPRPPSYIAATVGAALGWIRDRQQQQRGHVNRLGAEARAWMELSR